MGRSIILDDDRGDAGLLEQSVSTGRLPIHEADVTDCPRLSRSSSLDPVPSAQNTQPPTALCRLLLVLLIASSALRSITDPTLTNG